MNNDSDRFIEDSETRMMPNYLDSSVKRDWGIYFGVDGEDEDNSTMDMSERNDLNNISDKYLKELFKRSYDEQSEMIIITVFSVLIVLGVLGNSLVCLVVLKRPKMRTPRNIFIINLAVSDLTLCLFTQPFNLVKLLRSRWVLGQTMCKLIPACIATNFYVSTISITAIALDRFQVIVYPTRDPMKTGRVVCMSLFFVWLASIFMALPIVFFYELKPFFIWGVFIHDVCMENSDFSSERKIYSLVSMTLLYLAPIVAVTASHALISRKLKNRMVNRGSDGGSCRGNRKSAKRRVRGEGSCLISGAEKIEKLNSGQTNSVVKIENKSPGHGDRRNSLCLKPAEKMTSEKIKVSSELDDFSFQHERGKNLDNNDKKLQKTHQTVQAGKDYADRIAAGSNKAIRASSDGAICGECKACDGDTADGDDYNNDNNDDSNGDDSKKISKKCIERFREKFKYFPEKADVTASCHFEITKCLKAADIPNESSPDLTSSVSATIKAENQKIIRFENIHSTTSDKNKNDFEKNFCKNSAVKLRDRMLTLRPNLRREQRQQSHRHQLLKLETQLKKCKHSQNITHLENRRILNASHRQITHSLTPSPQTKTRDFGLAATSSSLGCLEIVSQITDSYENSCKTQTEYSEIRNKKLESKKCLKITRSLDNSKSTPKTRTLYSVQSIKPTFKNPLDKISIFPGAGCTASVAAATNVAPSQMNQVAKVPHTEEMSALDKQRKSRKAAKKRKKRTNRLLITIALVFAISWLPMNIINLLSDFQSDLVYSLNRLFDQLLAPACLLLVLVSACVNPLLYGWLNENFRQEFQQILCCCNRVTTRRSTNSASTRARFGSPHFQTLSTNN